MTGFDTHALRQSGLLPELGRGVRAWFSTRDHGVSQAPYASLNLGDHVGDVPAAVQENRRRVAAVVNAEVAWLAQVHGPRVLTLQRHGMPPQDNPWRPGAASSPVQADGAITADPGVACAVMVADCLPVLLAAPEGRAVGALHAGWRGLAGAGAMQGRGVMEQGVTALCELASCDPADVRVWLGPCIGPDAFEVGAVVLEAFGVSPSLNPLALPPQFKPLVASSPQSEPKWRADLQGLAALRLHGLGVRHVQATALCTVSDPGRFFSFRRDGVTGRMVALIARDVDGR